ncbi:MAG: hypothetical protein WBA23_09435 [Tunicatimonas sp.]
MKTFILKTVKLSFAFAILATTLFSCSEEAINPDESMGMPKKSEVVPR